MFSFLSFEFTLLYNWRCSVWYSTSYLQHQTEKQKGFRSNKASWSSGSQTFHHRGPHDINFCDLTEKIITERNLSLPNCHKTWINYTSLSQNTERPTMCLSHAWLLHRPTCLAHRRYLGSVKKSWFETCSASFYHQFGLSGLDLICRGLSVYLSSTDPWVTLTGPKSFYSDSATMLPSWKHQTPIENETKCLDADPNNHILYHQSNSNLTNHLWIWSLQNICPPCWPQAIPGHYIHKMWTCKPCFYIETTYEFWKFALNIPMSNQHSHYSTGLLTIKTY